MNSKNVNTNRVTQTFKKKSYIIVLILIFFLLIFNIVLLALCASLYLVNPNFLSDLVVVTLLVVV